jgi:DNA (cytosine-5)-methyltransferase 1
MSYGLAAAGVKVIGGIDIDGSCRETYETNVAGARFIQSDVSSVEPEKLMRQLGVKKDDDSLIMVGCSPCQFWSKINTNKTRSKQTAFLLSEFGKFISASRPGWVVVENVPGILNKKGSALPDFIELLGSLDYKFSHGLIDMSKFGVPQTRHRFVLIASRLPCVPNLPDSLSHSVKTVRDFLGVDNGFARITAGHTDKSQFLHSSSGLSDLNLARIRATPLNGGTRAAWAQQTELSVATYVGRSKQFADVYSRMAWDKPAPTITTRFNSYSNGRFGHPEEDRAISLREGATLQTFPRSFRFFGSMPTVARHIGNAVPPQFAKRLGHHLLKLHRLTAV